MNPVMKWLTSPAPFWKFWMPGSGAVGGAILSTIAYLLITLVIRMGGESWVR